MGRILQSPERGQEASCTAHASDPLPEYRGIHRGYEGEREERIQFERLFTVSISRFFRDRKLWEIMQGEMLPLLAQIRLKSYMYGRLGVPQGRRFTALRYYGRACENLIPISLIYTFWPQT